MSYVLDASSLIYLGKIKVLDKLDVLDGKIYITPSVYEEVVTKGYERKEPETKYVESLVKNEGKISLRSPEHLIKEEVSLTKADREVISLAKELRGKAIIDEEQARLVSNSYVVENHGSIYLIIQLVKKKALSKKEAVYYIDKMIELGFYLSAGIYKDILEIINAI